MVSTRCNRPGTRRTRFITGELRCCVVPSPNWPLPFRAHGPQASIRLQNQAVTTANSDRSNPLEKNLLGRIVLVRRSIAELAVSIFAHGPQTSVRLYDENYANSRSLPTARHFARNLASGVFLLRRRAIAELAESVGACGPQAPVHLDNQG